MKNLYLIGGTMGVGKTTVCNRLKKELDNSVFFDGDWCWDSNPWVINEETRAMVIDNILKGIDLKDCNVKLISLVCNEANLIARLRSDVINDVRDSNEIIYSSLKKLPLYANLHTTKIDTSNKSIDQIVREIKRL